MTKETRTFAVEHHSIDSIPQSKRHGSVFGLFTLWFSANMQITTVVTGALAVILGLPLIWALVAIVVGNVLGGIFMALYSAQGPTMGVPQMIQSRAQFGFYGAILPLVLVILMYLSFLASSAVLGGQALSAWTALPVTSSIIIVSAVCTVLAVYGYDIIHRYEGVVSILFLVGFLYLTIRLLTGSAVGSTLSASSFSFGTFLLVVPIIATWQITYGPYVADYSRYLPRRTPMSAPFWWTYAGSVLSSIWMMALGSIVVAVAGARFENNSVRSIVEQAGAGLGGIFYFVLTGWRQPALREQRLVSALPTVFSHIEKGDMLSGYNRLRASAQCPNAARDRTCPRGDSRGNPCDPHAAFSNLQCDEWRERLSQARESAASRVLQGARGHL